MSMLQLLRNFSGENLEKYKKQRQGGEKAEKKKEKKEKKEKKTEDGKGKKTSEKEAVRRKAPVLMLVSTDPGQTYTFAVKKDRFRIGRKESNDAVLKNILSVSREHCAIVREGGAYYVEDLNSKYGTKVDGVACVPGGRSGALHEQSVIELAEISFRVEFRP